MRSLIIGLIAVTSIASANEAAKPATPANLSPPMKVEAKQSELPKLVVYKTEHCGCCLGWVKHMEDNGFKVEVKTDNNLDPIRQALGVPPKLQSCHSAKIDRYFVEGHVPAEDVKRLLAERPNAMGIAVPKMPIGSPGMEQGNYKEPYETILLERGGKQSVWAKHGEK